VKAIVKRPEKSIDCEIAVGGSKSISNRALIIRALCRGGFGIANCSDSEDTALLAKCLRGIGGDLFDVNHAGTAFRFLTALFSITPGTRVLTGSERLKQRPVRELADVMRSLGAGIRYLGKDGFAPLEITGKPLEGGTIAIRGDISSQFISALLLIGPYLENGLDIRLTTDLVSRPYVEMTIALMKQFGAGVRETAHGFSVQPGKYSFAEEQLTIESDWSSAGYWYAVAALFPGSRIKLKYFSEKSLQADKKLSELFQDLGVRTAFGENELVLTNVPRSAETFAFDFIDCPDVAQTLAVSCAALGIRAQLKGLQTLKVKETDRIEALRCELTKYGIAAEATDSSLGISGTVKASALPVKTYHDHRMAMSFAPLACVLGSITISDAAVVEKSYPNFWKDLAAAGFDVSFSE
jgi:3-phosphoshikimate 1-carboxyvinyltransferase